MLPYTAHSAGALTIAAMMRDEAIAECEARNLAREAELARRAAVRAGARTASRPVSARLTRLFTLPGRRAGSMLVAGH